MDSRLEHISRGLAQDVTIETVRRFAPDLFRPDTDVQPEPGLIDPRAAVLVDHIADRLTVRLKGKLLAEVLPPTHVHHVWHGTHHFDLQTTAPRHATWWDFFKDTYRSRWWAGWLVRRRPVRYVEQPVTFREDRTCAHDVQVDVGAAWTYPQAPAAFRAGLHLGPSILNTWHDGGRLASVDLNADRL